MITHPRCTHRNNTCMLRYYPVEKPLGVSQWIKSPASNSPTVGKVYIIKQFILSKVPEQDSCRTDISPKISYFSASWSILQGFIRHLEELQRVCWIWLYFNNSLGRGNLMQLSHSLVGKNLHGLFSCLQGYSGTSWPLCTDKLPKLHWFNSLLQDGIHTLVSLSGAKFCSNVLKDSPAVNVITKCLWIRCATFSSAASSHAYQETVALT